MGNTAGAAIDPEQDEQVRRQRHEEGARPHREGGRAHGRGPHLEGPHRLLPLRRRGEQLRAGAEDVPDERTGPRRGRELSQVNV